MEHLASHAGYELIDKRIMKGEQINMTGAEYCKSCEKLDVCMYSKEMTRVVDEADENIKKSSFKDNITIYYRCKSYKSKPQGNIR